MNKIIHKNKETQRRLKKYCYQSGQYKGWGWTYADINWSETGQRYINQTKGGGMKWLKKHGNRKIRNYKGDLKNGGHCYKVFNAKWEYY